VCPRERGAGAQKGKKSGVHFHRELVLGTSDLASSIWHLRCPCTVLGAAAGAPQKCPRVPSHAHLGVVAVSESRCWQEGENHALILFYF